MPPTNVVRATCPSGARPGNSVLEFKMSLIDFTPAPPIPDAATFLAANKAKPGVVTVEVDTIAQPHAMVSGHVTFSDGEKADWYIDHQGRPGMAARTPGYRPTPQDITDFQVKLDAALRQAGY